jgi:hypothetical protein
MYQTSFLPKQERISYLLFLVLGILRDEQRNTLVNTTFMKVRLYLLLKADVKRLKLHNHKNASRQPFTIKHTSCLLVPTEGPIYSPRRLYSASGVNAVASSPSENDETFSMMNVPSWHSISTVTALLTFFYQE